MKKIIIQPETLAYLGEQWGITEDNLSPLFNIKLGKGNAKEINRLKKEGILDSNEKPTNEYRACFLVFENAEYRSVISMTGNGSDFEIQAFEDDAGNKASLLATAEGLEIQEMPDLEAFQIAIAQYTGQSLIKSADISISCDLNLMIILAAIIDITRKSLMMMYFENTNQVVVCSETDILKALEESIDNGQYLAMYVKSLGRIADIDISKMIGELEKLNYIKVVSGGWILSAELNQKIMGWILVENFVQISFTRKNANNTINQLNAWILQFGIHDLIVLEKKNTTITLKTISGGELLGLIEQSINPKEILSKIPSVSETNIDDSGYKKQFCSNCGTPVKKNTKFCGKCGKPI